MSVFCRYLIIGMMSICLMATAHAETLTLLSGQKINGQIIAYNEMRVIVDIQGTPRTFYLGEIATIDGKAIDFPEPPPQTPPPEEKKAVVPYYNDEQDSLARFMNVRNTQAVPQKLVLQKPSLVPPKPVASQKPVAPVAVAPAAIPPAPVPAPPPHPSTGLPSGPAVQNVVSTPDGGIIVVSHDKLIKYDKDLRVIKEVDLK